MTPRVSTERATPGRVQRLVARGELRACRVIEPTIDRTLLIGLPDNRPTTRLMRAVVAEIHATAADLADEARWTTPA